MAFDLPRRSLLRWGAVALVAGTGAACSARATSAASGAGAGRPRGRSGAAVDAAAVAVAVAAERRLIAGYDALLPLASGADRRTLERLRAQHVAHLAGLGSAPPAASTPTLTSASPGSAASQPARAVAALAHLEATTSHRLARQALWLSGADTAALLASVAASHAAHSELLAAVHLRPPAASRRTRHSRRRQR